MQPNSAMSPDDAHLRGVFVVPQSPPPSWSPPSSATYANSRALNGAVMTRSESRCRRLLRDLRVFDFACAAVVWVLSRTIKYMVDISQRECAVWLWVVGDVHANGQVLQAISRASRSS